jgi:hypothetical protein
MRELSLALSRVLTLWYDYRVGRDLTQEERRIKQVAAVFKGDHNVPV